MDRLKQLWKQVSADLEAWASRLSPRERVMVSLAGLAIALFVVFLVAFQLQAGVRAREARIDEKTRALGQVAALAGGYRQVQAERAAMQARLRGPPVQLMSHVSQTGTTLGVEVTDLRPSGAPVELDGVTEESVEVNLPRIELSRLARLLQGLERSQGFVKVRRLRLATRTDDPKLVDATVVVATYQIKG
ncbi:MAG TPA: type II secretion system protein GspM [Anaeromyxobacteraceae bacterium]|nr:type II secretion system protein GspM [Anaeromyxobacteraceae bacterium]